MEISLSDYITTKYKDFADKPEETLKVISKEKNKAYNDAVKCFQIRVNKDRKKAGQKDLPFMAIKMKLAALKEVDDLRIWYKTCLEYSYRKDKQGKRKTFSQCFWGGTKCK